MSRAITLDQLRAAARSIPNGEPRSPYVRVPLDSAGTYALGPSWAGVHPDEVFRTIEFRAKRTSVEGLPAWAWFYGDVLVKVSV